MNVRDATPEDEGWILDALDELGMFDPGFRSYRYVVVTDDGERVGMGRLQEVDEYTAQLNYVGVVAGKEPVVKAYAANELVRRALDDGYRRIVVAAESKRPYKAVGFVEEIDASTVSIQATDDEDVLKWIPKSERDEESQESDSDEDETEAESEASTNHKYDPSSDSPATESDSDEELDGDEDSAEVAAKRQGIDPDSVNTKYDSQASSDSTKTKYR